MPCSLLSLPRLSLCKAINFRPLTVANLVGAVTAKALASIANLRLELNYDSSGRLEHRTGNDPSTAVD